MVQGVSCKDYGYPTGHKILLICWTWRVISIHECHYWILFWVSWLKFTPLHSISPRSISLLSSIYVCLTTAHFSSAFLTKILYAFIISYICVACITHVIFIDSTTLIISSGRENYEAPHYEFSPTSCYFHSLRSKYCPQSRRTIEWNV